MAAKNTALEELGDMLAHVVKHMTTKDDIADIRREMATKGDIAAIERHLGIEMRLHRERKLSNPVALPVSPVSANRIGGDRACYVPALDLIAVPPESAFNTREHFLATTLHELARRGGGALAQGEKPGKPGGIAV